MSIVKDFILYSKSVQYCTVKYRTVQYSQGGRAQLDFSLAWLEAD
jgi:hypothetical protein